MRWIAAIIALAISACSVSDARLAATRGAGVNPATGSNRDCRIAGAWVRKDYVDAIVAGKSPLEAFPGARPVSALIISPGCDSLLLVNNFHEAGLYWMEQRPDSVWDLFEIIRHEYRYSFGFMMKDSFLVVVDKNVKYVFLRYPDKYDERKMPVEFVHEHTIAGSYRELYPDSGEVNFLIGGGLEGMKRYLRFEVGYDFVLDHCNYMLFLGPTRADHSTFFWAFKGDTLELQPYDWPHCEESQERAAAFRFVRIAR